MTRVETSSHERAKTPRERQDEAEQIARNLCGGAASDRTRKACEDFFEFADEHTGEELTEDLDYQEKLRHIFECQSEEDSTKLPRTDNPRQKRRVNFQFRDKPKREQ